MTYDRPPRSEDVSAFQKGLHLSDTQWPSQQRLQQRQTPETVVLEGEQHADHGFHRTLNTQTHTHKELWIWSGDYFFPLHFWLIFNIVMQYFFFL